MLAVRLINLADKIQNLSATLAGNKFKLCLALVTGVFICLKCADTGISLKNVS